MLKKPASGGMPAMAIEPMSIVQWVIGILRHRPPMRFMSCSSWTAWMTEPRAQEEEALEEAVRHEVEDRG